MSQTIAAPTGPLLGIPDVQAWLNLDGTENEDALEAAVQGASDAVINALGWDPRIQTYTETVDAKGGNALKVRNGYISAVISINFLPGAGAPPAPMDMTLITWDDRAPVIYGAAGFYRGRRNYQVVYNSGFVGVPSPILLATRYTIKAMLDGAGADFNATGESYAGVLSRTWNAGGPAVVPPSALSLLVKYQRTL
jgi:hypothetical protein